jgi:hypothetical protein
LEKWSWREGFRITAKTLKNTSTRGRNGTTPERRLKMAKNNSEFSEGGWFNREFYSFAKASFTFAAAKLVAITSFTYTEEHALDPLYGAGAKPVAMRRGNYRLPIDFTVYMEDYIRVIRGNIGDLMNHDPFDMTVSLAKREQKNIITASFLQVHLKKIGAPFESSGKGILVTLEGECRDGMRWK